MVNAWLWALYKLITFYNMKAPWLKSGKVQRQNNTWLYIGKDYGLDW